MSRKPFYSQTNSSTFTFGTEFTDKLYQIPSGIYNYVPPSPMGGGNYIQMRPSPKHDQLINLNDKNFRLILNELQTFWSKETKAAFDRYQMLYRRGILVHGKPGTGKTSLFIQIMEHFVNHEDGIVLIDPNPRMVPTIASMVREREPNKKFLVVYEEFEDTLDNYGEAVFLNLLDGQTQIDNVVYLAATNYLDQIPPRFKNRPSRFARVIEISPPEAELRREFILRKIHPEDRPKVMENIDEWVEKTEGLVLDHIKELVLSVLCMGEPLETAVERLKKMNTEDLCR